MLLDTGSDISLIKLYSLADDTWIDDTIQLELQGIHEQVIKTLGKTTLTLNLGNKIKTYDFHVVPIQFNLRTDGVIGRDLLVNLKASIDYGERILQIGLNKIHLCNPVINIPPKSEKIVQVILNKNGNGLVEQQEIEPGVYIPNVIVESRQYKAQVVIINTTNHEINASKIHCQLTNVITNTTLIKQGEVTEHLKLDHLPSNERDVIVELCNEYRDIFYIPGDKLTATNSIEHEIPLIQNSPPVNVRAYRIPHHQKDEVDRQVNKLLIDEIIRPSSSPFNAPIILVPKKLDNSGIKKWRMAVDLRKLNDVTIGDSYPLPNITEILDQLGNSRYYTALDLASGYHQIPVKEEDRHKTAFSTSNGHFEFNRMPFGAKGAPAVFQRLMNTVLAGLIKNTCMVYLDDVIIYSETLQEHRDKLKLVFDRLRQHNLQLQPDKCNFLMREIKYLGHVINGQGVAPDPEKTRAISKYPVPQTPKQVKSFLGLIGYYRKFISHFAQTAKPLNNLLRRNVNFIWEEEQEQAFQSLKNALTTEPILCYPDFKKEFILTTDASKIALGAILSQGEIGRDLPIAYASRTLNKAESNYSTTEQELLAIVWATKHFRPYLYGRKFKIVTDHKPLKWLFSIKDPGSRLMRWRLKLEEYEYEIVYKAGKTNVNADALSRVEIKVTQVNDKKEVFTENLTEEKQEENQSTIEDKNNIKLKIYKDKVGNYRHWITNKRDQLQLLKEYHDNPLGGHQGQHRTLAALRLKYYWPKMKEDLINYIKTCVSCNQRKTTHVENKPVPLQISNTPHRPFEHVALDIVGPLPLTIKGNKYLLTFQDVFTKYPEAFPIPEQSVNTVARTFVSKIICRHGCPDSLTTDLGTNFTSNLFTEVCKLLNINKIHTTAYHPEANGVVERSHQTMMNYLSHYINKDQTDWDEWIDYALMAYRTTPHSVTGYSPYYLTHGREARLPTEIITGEISTDLSEEDYIQGIVTNLHKAYQEARSNILRNKETSKRYYDLGSQNKVFAPGDLVLMYDPTVKRGRSKKLKKPWLGPYKILEKLSDVNYKIKKGRKEYITHANRIKHFRLRAITKI